MSWEKGKKGRLGRRNHHREEGKRKKSTTQRVNALAGPEVGRAEREEERRGFLFSEEKKEACSGTSSRKTGGSVSQPTNRRKKKGQDHDHRKGWPAKIIQRSQRGPTVVQEQRKKSTRTSNGRTGGRNADPDRKETGTKKRSQIPTGEWRKGGGHSTMGITSALTSSCHFTGGRRKRHAGCRES